MIDSHTLGLYVAAAFALAITPGPGIFYVLTRSIKGGRSEGYASALGTAVGGFFHVCAAALGLSTVLATSAVAFGVVKYLGAAYLVYLGIKTIRGKESAFAIGEAPPAYGSSGRQAIYQGIMTEILNPKTALFFLAFIPQFIRPGGSVVLQFILLGSIAVILNSSADLVVVTLAGPIASQFRKRARMRHVQRILTGCGMIALGAYVALAGTDRQTG